jgi:hypothetical protein
MYEVKMRRVLEQTVFVMATSPRGAIEDAEVLTCDSPPDAWEILGDEWEAVTPVPFHVPEAGYWSGGPNGEWVLD